MVSGFKNIKWFQVVVTVMLAVVALSFYFGQQNADAAVTAERMDECIKSIDKLMIKAAEHQKDIQILTTTIRQSIEDCKQRDKVIMKLQINQTKLVIILDALQEKYEND